MIARARDVDPPTVAFAPAITAPLRKLADWSGRIPLHPSLLAGGGAGLAVLVAVAVVVVAYALVGVGFLVVAVVAPIGAWL